MVKGSRDVKSHPNLKGQVHIQPGTGKGSRCHLLLLPPKCPPVLDGQEAGGDGRVEGGRLGSHVLEPHLRLLSPSSCCFQILLLSVTLGDIRV